MGALPCAKCLNSEKMSSRGRAQGAAISVTNGPNGPCFPSFTKRLESGVLETPSDLKPQGRCGLGAAFESRDWEGTGDWEGTRSPPFFPTLTLRVSKCLLALVGEPGQGGGVKGVAHQVI